MGRQHLFLIAVSFQSGTRIRPDAIPIGISGHAAARGRTGTGTPTARDGLSSISGAERELNPRVSTNTIVQSTRLCTSVAIHTRQMAETDGYRADRHHAARAENPRAQKRALPWFEAPRSPAWPRA